MNKALEKAVETVIAIILVITVSTAANAQQADSVWFNKKWEETSDPQQRHFLRTIKSFDNVFEVTDFYPNGRVQMIGYFTSIKPENRHGEFKYYSAEGTLTSKNIWVNNLVAETFTYDAAGKQTLHVVKKEYLATLSAEEKLKKYGIKEIDKQPKFPGGNISISTFLTKNIVYPAQALQDNIQGRVIIAATINEKGHLTNVRVAQKAHPLLDEEALRVASLLPKKKWTPAQNKGENITADFIFPIMFKQ